MFETVNNNSIPTIVGYDAISIEMKCWQNEAFHIVLYTILVSEARVTHEHSPLGTYKLTYEEGVALCISKGARIATKQQLETALRLGFSK